MKKDVFLVLCCYKKEFKEYAKQGYKCNMMFYRCNCSPVWATSSKEEAIADCCKHNKLDFDKCMFFTLPINLYCK